MTHLFSQNIINNLSFLKKLSKRNTPTTFSVLILNATQSQILSIVEICNNILNYNIILTYPQKIKLAKYAAFYRNIARCSLENKARKCILKRLHKEGYTALSTLVKPVIKAIKDNENTVKKSLPRTDPSTCFINEEPQKTQEQIDYVVNSERIISALRERKVACPKCIKNFDKRKYLKDHLKNIHRSLMYFPCKYNPQCMLLFKTEIDKLKHIRFTHS